VEIERFSTRPTRRRLTVQTAVCSDDGEKVAAVWFNQPWLEKQLRPGMRVRLRGRLQGRGDFLVKAFDVGERSATADFAPVYPASEEITPKKLREVVARYRAALPFRLTDHQERAIAEIDNDLRRSVPMLRLLQGDVGSGKTVVALYAILRAVETGRQAALMAPTETLAEQHFLTVEEICRELGVTCALLTSASPKRERAHAQSA